MIRGQLAGTLRPEETSQVETQSSVVDILSQSRSKLE